MGYNNSTLPIRKLYEAASRINTNRLYEAFNQIFLKLDIPHIVKQCHRFSWCHWLGCVPWLDERFKEFRNTGYLRKQRNPITPNTFRKTRTIVSLTMPLHHAQNST